MPLDLHQAATKLGVSPATVQRWARQGRLGLQRPSGDYLFEERELQQWARNQGLKIRNELKKPKNARALQDKPLSAALAKGAILHNVPGHTPGEVLSTLVELSPVTEDRDRTDLLQQLIAREALASTGLSAGVALPHPRTPTADFTDYPIVVIAMLENPVDWLSLDGELVHTAVMLLSPTPQEHLQVLSRVALVLRNEKVIAALKARQSATDIFNLIDSLEPSSNG
ncbi:MAG: PTS sugar transporter subunit IIA [Planctomycetes bacterium]|nr:PTS sugar transporter subunit IIA [Planctomycetota bacterium]